jgi:hypothetical protein
MSEFERLLQHAGIQSPWDLPAGAHQLGRYACSNGFSRYAYPDLPSFGTYQWGWEIRAWELENEVPGEPLGPCPFGSGRYP